MSSLAFVTNLAGGPGWIILLVIVLLFGAKRLPELGRSIGETIKEFGKGKEEKEDQELTDKKDDKDKKPPVV